MNKKRIGLVAAGIAATMFCLFFHEVHLGHGTELDATNLKKIKAYDGEFVSISGIVKTTGISPSGKVRWLNFATDYRKAFTVVIFEGDLDKFSSSVGEPTEFYLHKEVKVDGLVSLYKKKPQIIVNTPSQIAIVKDDFRPEVVLDATDHEKISEYSGKLVTVTGKVANTHVAKSGKIRFLDFSHKKNHGFSAIIFTGDLQNFRKQGEPAVYYDGAQIKISGFVSIYKDRPQIRISSPIQVKVLD